jgi:hypothetical protein
VNFLTKLLLWSALSLFLAFGAKASPVCHEKADVYELALADMQGTGNDIWTQKVSAGDCAHIKQAKYLGTPLWTYDADKLSRTVEYMLWGKSVYGPITTLPPGVWLIQHEGHAQDLPLHDTFYSTWLMPNGHDERKYSCCNEKDCYPTPIQLKDGKYYARRREDGEWIEIPEGKLEQNQDDPRESPDYQSHACIAPPHLGHVVYCATLGAGI